MEATRLNFNISLEFDQIIELIRQLPKKKRSELTEFLVKENPVKDQDVVLTHFASEAVLAKDWLSPEEDEAWKDL